MFLQASHVQMQHWTTVKLSECTWGFLGYRAIPHRKSQTRQSQPNKMWLIFLNLNDVFVYFSGLAKVQLPKVENLPT